MKDYIQLKPLVETKEDWDVAEKRIRELFRKLIYLPILKDLGESHTVLMNSADDYRALSDALFAGKITFYRGTFSGKFNAAISKDLKRIGGKWDRKSSTFKIAQSSLPTEIKSIIAASEDVFEKRMGKIDQKLSQILPEELADQLKVSDVFDHALWKTDKSFEANVKKITVSPKLTKEERKKIADEWQNNMKLYIKDFAGKQIKDLRKEMQANVFSGRRYEGMIDTIQKSYGVSVNKAKFLARQETSLLMAKFESARYQSAGINEYTWHCVSGTKARPVRKRHRELNDLSKKGKTFRFDSPPNTAEEGESPRYNNPKEDYNCRCYARPIIKFKK